MAVGSKIIEIYLYPCHDLTVNFPLEPSIDIPDPPSITARPNNLVQSFGLNGTIRTINGGSGSIYNITIRYIETNGHNIFGPIFGVNGNQIM